MTSTREAVDDLLSAIEMRELRSLQWGFVDGAFREADVDELARQVLAARGLEGDAEGLVEELLSARLIFEVGSSDRSPSYRSRFAETVRLLVHLRQLFDGRPWASSPRLVSDFRLDASPRPFARRDLEPETLLEELRKAGASTDERERLTRLVIGPKDGGLLLAGFQVRVAVRLLSQNARGSGVIVTAGTGSGKTLAFYLPALLEVAPIVDARRHWTKCVAVYPRIELLKDQFSEAFRLFRIVDDELVRRQRRPITLGALFSLTPTQARESDLVDVGWQRFGNHFVCPFLRCPVCGSDMVWRRDDLERGHERLECTDAPRCSGSASDHEVILTRRRMLAHPPDFVFTTIETLNQRLSDPRYNACLGVHRAESERLRLVLLDEVHTYSGTQGAHAAMVIRRWRHAANAGHPFVGLSATLRDAPRFFAELTGIDERWIGEVTPDIDEYDRQGMAYQAVLRGDPGARTSLLSTSIQAAMLLPRLLDPRPSGRATGVSNGRFGQRLFVFTDDLDITNRLFDDLRDAEAYDNFGNPDPARAPLAALRASNALDAAPRGRDGQRWDASEQMGHDLNRRLGVTRTTSKDAGVSSGSEVVVATSALEVGFNDPHVGGVLQHKAPRSLAAFLQRKGRAGRTIDMRPWMLTVLSDYGRDRLTFQTYERLLDPVLPPQRLPVKNRYVLRMQAVFALIDWLGLAERAASSRAWPWWPLNGPATTDFARRQQAAIASILGGLLDGDRHLVESLREHLRRSLALDDDREVDAVLWAPPRSLLLEVIPTLWRRLKTQWAAADGNKSARDLFSSEGAPHPLPDFLPANLFSDLNLPEVAVVIPPAARGATERRESLPILQALRLLVPGRVTRRFAHERGGLNHWVPVPLDAAEMVLPIPDYADQFEFVASVPLWVDGVAHDVACFRPWTIRVQRAPMPVRPTSNAEFTWLSRLLPTTEPVRLPVASSNPWHRLVEGIEFFLHSRRASVTVQRYAHEGTARVRLLRREADHVVQLRFVDAAGSPVAVGFEQEVDGLRVLLSLPSAEMVAELVGTSGELVAWRAAFFRDLIRHDTEIAAATNRFQRDWIHQIYLSALVSEAAASSSDLRGAVAEVSRKGVGDVCRQVMDELFRFDPITPEGLDAWEGEEADESPRLSEAPRLVQSLAPLFAEAWLTDRLESLAATLWVPAADAAFTEWLKDRLTDTVGEAVSLACSYLVPAYAGSDVLVLDVSDRSDTSGLGAPDVWITESILGGAGVLDAVGRGFAADPASFVRALDAAVAPSDLEIVASNLERVLVLLNEDPAIRAAATAVRSRDDHTERDNARGVLYDLLAERGIGVDHSLSVAMNQRLLRRGSSSESDRLLLDLQRHWQALEERIGVSIDLRTYAYVASVDPGFGDRLREMVLAVAGHSPSTSEIVGVLSGVLWPHPSEVRGRSLETHSPFRESGRADPALVRLILEGGDEAVSVERDGWEQQVSEVLARDGAVQLIANRDIEAKVAGALCRLLALPIDVGYLQFFPSVDRVRRDSQQTAVRLVVRELA
jgi:hypothetical protein